MEAITNIKNNTNKTTSTFSINGMTCGSCVDKITQRIKSIPGVSWANVNLAEKKVDLISDGAISLSEIKASIADLPKYSADYYDEVVVSNNNATAGEKTFFQTYKPLFTVFAYILVFSAAYQIQLGEFSAHHLMNHIMAGFFIGLSFFKFLDLTAFANSFANYDPLAKKWKSYGLIYPFVELVLGFLFIADKYLLFANIMTIIVLSLTTIGVYNKLRSKVQFQCACLGTGFSLPLSNITIFENLAMVAMAFASIYYPF